MTKILIANRGEIAVRILRACRDLALRTVAVYSECDRSSLHVRRADEAYPIGSSAAIDSYLRVDRIIDAARRSGADAIHPGYGFLAENPSLARACADAGLVFIGPTADAIERMGSKTAARAVAESVGVPVVPGENHPLGADAPAEAIEALARGVGYPLLVKAVAGGGGKGMRRVESPDRLTDAVRAARSEAASSFGDPAIYFERELRGARHVEVQVLGDRDGQVVAFVERECSIQRRHQKVVEETPSPAVTPALRNALTEAACRVARAVQYTNAGTIEFLLDDRGRFYFLEMNTRLQVEHPITELVTGVDLVRWQIRLAQGDLLDLDPASLVRPSGHAIECRIYAEDPDRGFLPSPGRITHLNAPSGPGIREDRGVEAGSEVPIFYDSLLSKLTAWGADRGTALARMRRALGEYDLRGVETTLPLFRWLLEDPDFLAGRFDTTFLDRALAARPGESFHDAPTALEADAAIAAALYCVLRAERRASTQDAAATTPGGAWARQARLDALR